MLFVTWTHIGYSSSELCVGKAFKQYLNSQLTKDIQCCNHWNTIKVVLISAPCLSGWDISMETNLLVYIINHNTITWKSAWVLHVCKMVSTLNYTCPQPETALTHLHECRKVKDGVASTCSSFVLHPPSLMRKGFWWHKPESSGPLQKLRATITHTFRAVFMK